MKLSVVIVNYNVKYFLEQCLHSVIKASKKIATEIFVVDNNSADGSSNLVKDKFPDIHLIQNSDNYGFSYANNQAIKLAKGEYILLLNPDTVVEENTFGKIIHFMDENPDAGGLGVRMIDGKGKFLPESKRGLPTPWVAFYKVFGLSKLFPGSKKFGKYHMAYLPENETSQVEVLAGAFMLLRKKALDKVGLLDESFFMYGEDIDLSYRLSLGGYKNYYFPETTIIHYKGESTKKESLNYIRIFYNAMIIFAKKHFSGSKAMLFSLFIRIAIYFRAFLAILNQLWNRFYLPLLDAIVIFAGFLFIIPFWENMMYNPGYYPDILPQIAVPLYILIWIGGVFLSGGYHRPINLWAFIRGLIWGTVVILLIYSLVDEQYRFSRAIILLGAFWALISLLFFRVLFHFLGIKEFVLSNAKPKKIAIVGDKKEAVRVQNILEQTQLRMEIVGYISINQSDNSKDFIGDIQQLKDIVRINKIEELIYCAENIGSADIIRSMLDLTGMDIDYKIAPPESHSIIGSNSIHTSGDLYVVNVNAISKSRNRYGKRIFDVITGSFLFILIPVICWFYRDKKMLIKNIIQVITGKYSWVGYLYGSELNHLPIIKQGILNPGDLFPDIKMDKNKKIQLNLSYAQDYRLLNDLEILLKNLPVINRKNG